MSPLDELVDEMVPRDTALKLAREAAAYKQAWTRLSNVVKGETIHVHDPREAVHEIEKRLQRALEQK